MLSPSPRRSKIPGFYGRVVFQEQAEKYSLFRFEKLVSINPAFDMAVDLGNVIQSQINTMSSKPYLSKTA